MQSFLFPAQGSQVRGIDEDLFDLLHELQSVDNHIDELLGFSVRELCLSDSQGRLGQTQYTQPAMYVVNAIHLYKALADEERPAVLAGHGLGEYNALLAAGVFDPLTALRLVKGHVS
jgi:malonyl CoA-acyl carrier protein transacylase